MSVQSISWVIDNSQHSLGPFIVLLMIANHAHADGTGAYPSVQTLAKECRMSQRQVQRCLRALENSGELKTLRGASPLGSNLYSLPLMRGTPPPQRGPQISTAGGDKLSRGGVTNRAKNMSKMSPKPSVTVQSQSLNLRPLTRPSSPTYGNLTPDDSKESQKPWLGKGKSRKKTAATPQRRRYANVGRLAEAAALILDSKPDFLDGDLTEELKQWAANEGVPYFDGWPGAATPIEQAITIAKARRKAA